MLPCAQLFERVLAASGGGLQIHVLDRQARLALQAADAALVASGTASLEALLCNCPMVVAYRLSSRNGLPGARAAPGKAAVFLAAQPARRRGAGSGILPGNGQR